MIPSLLSCEMILLHWRFRQDYQHAALGIPSLNHGCKALAQL
jgi:hypothetical protein